MPLEKGWLCTNIIVTYLFPGVGTSTHMQNCLSLNVSQCRKSVLTRGREARREGDPLESRRALALLVAVPLLQEPILLEQPLLHRHIALTGAALFQVCDLGLEFVDEFRDASLQLRGAWAELGQRELTDSNNTSVEKTLALLGELEVLGEHRRVCEDIERVEGRVVSQLYFLISIVISGTQSGKRINKDAP